MCEEQTRDWSKADNGLVCPASVGSALHAPTKSST